jgi:hypothetical protein
MPFDKPTRSLLARTVGQIRDLLADDIQKQLQSDFRMQPDGTCLSLDKMSNAQRAAALELRQLLDHFVAALPDPKQKSEAFARLVREIAFTVLNRLAALRLCEERGLVRECVRQGMTSAGFQLFDRLSGGALGTRYTTYRAFLEALFDELALDLPTLFDRRAPQSRVFPTERTLEAVLALLNAPAMTDLWREDETIGWIYEFTNDEAERERMRDAAPAPRNSRELAVRNQFFTPRYVVEFLTDNTLGRLWREMTQGQTTLQATCRYLVRRPIEVFLRDPDRLPVAPRAEWVMAAACGDFSALPEGPSIEELSEFSLVIDGYDLAERYGYGECIAWADRQIENYRQSATWPSSSLDLWLILFRQQRYYGRASHAIEDAFYEEWQSAYHAFRASLQTAGPSREALLRQPMYIPYRPLKDPRQIKLLDPAGGSGHFALYAFDLFEVIYAEAYDDAELGPALQRDYPDRAAFLRAVPRLILEHNLHIIDIDPRACQVAALALWLRAQRSWQEMNLRAAERPRITCTNVVCAEPMPGDAALLAEFCATLDPPLIGDLVRIVFEKMKLAGEAGSLLKIEVELADAIAAAHRQWQRGDQGQQLALFPEMLRPQRDQPTLFDLAGITDARFWETVEARVLDELRAYAESAGNGRAARRRLFAADAIQGFAFIDMCSQRYDVVLMNPPFGEASSESYEYINDAYNRVGWNNNLLCAFIERGWQLTEPSGDIGVIYDRTAAVKSTYEAFRRAVLIPDSRLKEMVDLGWGVLDANVETTTAVMHRLSSCAKGAFIDVRLVPVDEKGQYLLDVLSKLPTCDVNKVILADSITFQRLPNAVLGYDFPDFLRNVFDKFQSLQEVGFRAYQGHALKSDKHFRLWWEINLRERPNYLARMFNGAGFSPYYSSMRDYVVAPVNLDSLPKDTATVLRNKEKQGLPGICFGKRGDYFCVHLLPSLHIFTVEGQSIPISERDSAFELLVLRGVSSSPDNYALSGSPDPRRYAQAGNWRSPRSFVTGESFMPRCTSDLASQAAAPIDRVGDPEERTMSHGVRGHLALLECEPARPAMNLRWCSPLQSRRATVPGKWRRWRGWPRRSWDQATYPRRAST